MMTTPGRIVARRWLVALSVATTAAVVAGCGATSSSTAGGSGATDYGSVTLSLNGVALTVPVGWNSESFINRSGMSVFRVGSFAFPRRPDDDVGQIARSAMGPSDVLINIVDFTAVDSREGAPYTPATQPLTVNAAQAIPQEGYTVPAAVFSVRIHGHKLYLSVAFGRAPPSDAQVASANEVLRTLSAS